VRRFRYLPYYDVAETHDFFDIVEEVGEPTGSAEIVGKVTNSIGGDLEATQGVSVHLAYLFFCDPIRGSLRDL
jgi:hypothetical protein